MNKLFVKYIIFMTLIIFNLSIGASAAYEASVVASGVSCDDSTGQVYSTYYWGLDGGVRYASGNVSVSQLPYGMINKGEIFKFCIYNNKIYYVTGEGGSDYLPAYIYSCDLQGGNNRLLADNACNWSNVTIVDGYLYYDAFSSRMQSYFPGRIGGIYKINLNDLTWKKIVNDDLCIMHYCDGDYVYYKTDGRTFAIDVNGISCIAANANSDEFKSGYVIKGNTTYYMGDDRKKLYSKTKNGSNIRVLSSFAEATSIVGSSTDRIFVTALPKIGSSKGNTIYAYINAVKR